MIFVHVAVEENLRIVVEEKEKVKLVQSDITLIFHFAKRLLCASAAAGNLGILYQ